MAYLAGVQAYGTDDDTKEASSGSAAQDPATPALVQLFGFASETTRNWLTGLEVSPRGASAPSCQLDGVEIPTVDNIKAGANITLTKSGADVTIASTGGGGGGTSINGVYRIEGDGSPAYTDLGLSDEFSGGTLNPNWTVVTGTSGTVNLWGTSMSNTVYDLATRPGCMLVQIDDASSSYLQLRAPVIDNDEQLIVCMNVNPYAALTNNAFWCGLSVSSANTSHDAGSYIRFVWDGSDNNNVTTFDGGAIISRKYDGFFTSRTYWRVVRIADEYYWSFSIDGVTWIPMPKRTPGTAASYVWIILGVRAAVAPLTGEPAPISTINWIRHCAYTGLDPW